jgi:hypothetical protein
MAESATSARVAVRRTRGDREGYLRPVFSDQQASGMTHAEFCRRGSISRARYCHARAAAKRKSRCRRRVSPPPHPAHRLQEFPVEERLDLVRVGSADLRGHQEDKADALEVGDIGVEVDVGEGVLVVLVGEAAVS